MAISFSSRDVANVIVLRILGLILLVLSIAEVVIGSKIRLYIYTSFGSYYVAIFSIVSSISSLISVNVGCVIVACVFSVLSVLVGIVGTTLDAIGYIVFDSIEGCLNNEYSYSYAPGYNSAKYIAENIGVCTTTIIADNNPNYCYCISSFNSTVIINADGSQKELSGCWQFDIMDNSLNCNGLINDLPNYLKESASICGAIIFFSFILAVITCCSLCYPKTRQAENIFVVTTLNQPLNQPLNQQPIQGTVINTI